MNDADKLVIRMKGIEVRYTQEHTIVFNGVAYPRQLKAIHEIIQIFKEADKETGKEE